jgi:hypothetical protein
MLREGHLQIQQLFYHYLVNTSLYEFLYLTRWYHTQHTFGTQDFWNIILCRWVSVSWRFETKWCLHLQRQSSVTPLDFRLPPRSRWELRSYGSLRWVLVVTTQMSTVPNSRGILHPWWWRHHVLSHRHKTLTQRHNVISQKTRYAIVFVAQTSYLVEIISPFSWHWNSHVTDQHTALYSRSLGSNLVLETDYRTGVSSSFYLYPQTVAALKRFRTQQNPDLLTILHSDGIHSGQLTDYCEYHHLARITHVSFCRCTSPCFMPRIFSPETKSNSQHSKFYLQFLEVFRGSLTHVFTTRLYFTNESHKPVLRLFLVAVVCCPKNDVRKLGVHLLQIRANWKLHSSLLRDLSSSSIYWPIILSKKKLYSTVLEVQVT